MERVLLTGVTGFVGSHLARALLDGGTECHALVRPEANLGRIPDIADRISRYEDDGTAPGLAAIVKEVAPDATFHLATRFIAEHVPADVPGLVADNVTFPTRLAEALARAGSEGGSPPPFVNVGTAWQHVDGAPYRPKNLYASTKQAFEDVLAHYTHRGELRVVTVNLYDSYGPLDHRGKLIATLVDRARRGGASLDMSSGTQLIDLVHVDDIVAALRAAGDLCRAATEPAVGVFAASSARPMPLRDLVAVLERVAGHDLAINWGARPDRPGEMLTPWAAGPPVPGWQPRVTLEAGFRRLLDEAAETS